MSWWNRITRGQTDSEAQKQDDDNHTFADVGESSTIGSENSADTPESENDMPHALECRQLKKVYGETLAVRDVSLVVRPGEFTTLLGPSGCGKTTTLRLVAGFETPDEGTIMMSGRSVAGPQVNIPTEQRQIGMVFQEYALFPHLNVAENIAFGLDGKKADKARRVDEMLDMVGLGGLAERMPYELSGGQQQRIALARALAPNPRLLLLDEPFSNLDAALRSQVRGEVRAILKRAEITCLFVTHDQEEALSLSDRVVVMFDGIVAQDGPPQLVYMRPATREVAAFVGESNFLPGYVEDEIVHCALGRFPLMDSVRGEVDVLLRPEAVRLEADEDGVAIEWIEFYGHDQRMGLRLDDGTSLIVRADANQFFSTGQRVSVSTDGPVQVFPRR